MKICFCLHDHQPVGNFEHVMESAYTDCYLPMLEVLEAHGAIRSGLHISGSLMEWLEAGHPDYVERCAALCREQRMELLTGGRYEPVLTVFRRSDMSEQIRDYSSHLQGITGTRPRGLWLTERVWEPQLTSVLADSGVEWAVVDDLHLKRAGADDKQLFSPCVTEDSGSTLRLLASDMKMRYMIPFSPVNEVMEKLREYHESGVPLVFYGDDGEKFGVWPGTRDLCYGDGWLHRFLSAVESADWLETVLPSEAASLPACGPFYVPACSYSEMGEWTVHGSDRTDYDRARELLRDGGMGDSADRLLTGGFWRNFLSIYPESKELQGRILSSGEMVRSSGSARALHHLWRSQCNCAFWHGVFGGIYLPHLREAVWKELNKAEHTALSATEDHPMVTDCDLNADGRMETVVAAVSHSMIVHPERGLTVSHLAFIHSDGEPVMLGHVLSRRRESYHSSIPGRTSRDEVRTIHDDMGSKEPGLADRLTIDRWRRVCFTELVLPKEAGFEEWSSCSEAVESFEGSPDLSGPVRTGDSILFSGGFSRGNTSLEKQLCVDIRSPELAATVEFGGEPGARAGTEVCLNLMTGGSEDRFYRIDGGERRLMSAAGEFRGTVIEVTDLWRKISAVIEMEGESDIWVTPLDSVNRSENGYESVHQGTAFFISRRLDVKGGLTLKVALRMEFRDDTR
ncbi:MAG: alpha-amylase/4-alpha-glucanotransferase domain-containing protein [Candidatus Aegiribacteria sp.]